MVDVNVEVYQARQHQQTLAVNNLPALPLLPLLPWLTGGLSDEAGLHPEVSLLQLPPAGVEDKAASQQQFVCGHSRPGGSSLLSLSLA